jgi:hypothetical protein
MSRDVDLRSKVDRGALKRAMAMARAESPEHGRQLDAMLAARPWEEVATFAAYGCQCRNLRLRPWQAPPCHSHDQLGTGYGNQPNEVELRRRLRRAKLSIWEPDPIAALEAAEAACPRSH